MNGTLLPAGNWERGCFAGERIRLRFINGAANTVFTMSAYRVLS